MSNVPRRPVDEKDANGATVRDNIIADIKRYLGYGIDGGFTEWVKQGAPTQTLEQRKARKAA